jgi:hypothetical protein
MTAEEESTGRGIFILKTDTNRMVHNPSHVERPSN